LTRGEADIGIDRSSGSQYLSFMQATVQYHILGPQNAALLEGTDVFDDKVLPGELARFVADPGHMLVFATVDGVVAGFASGTILLHPDKPPGLFVNEVGVNEPYLRRGIALELTNRLFALARERGCKTSWLGTEPDNIEANGLYRKLGGKGPQCFVFYEWDLEPSE
jgi:ribosomal protein S18 acetylase RimI-like enzyme